MGDVSYLPLIEDMVWSYSRLTSFDSCPYQFFLRYIHGAESSPRFFTSYGIFLHDLLAGYYAGELSKEQALLRFMGEYFEQVQGPRPGNVDAAKYFRQGAGCLRSLAPPPLPTVAVEQTLSFSVGGFPFTGRLDYLGRKDGRLVLVDHKSRILKPRSRRKNPTKNDRRLDHMLRQLYLYAGAIREAYGEFPGALCFHCFRVGTVIQAPFQEDRYGEAIDWALSKIQEIQNAEEFPPKPDPFYCRYLCGVSEACEYCQEFS